MLTIVFTRIPFGTEENNLVGTLASEIALLPELAVWGMERGGLTGTLFKNLSSFLVDIYINSVT